MKYNLQDVKDKLFKIYGNGISNTPQQYGHINFVYDELIYKIWFNIDESNNYFAIPHIVDIPHLKFECDEGGDWEAELYPSGKIKGQGSRKNKKIIQHAIELFFKALDDVEYQEYLV